MGVETIVLIVGLIIAIGLTVGIVRSLRKLDR
jgi:hypothetical protein